MSEKGDGWAKAYVGWTASSETEFKAMMWTSGDKKLTLNGTKTEVEASVVRDWITALITTGAESAGNAVTALAADPIDAKLAAIKSQYGDPRRWSSLSTPSRALPGAAHGLCARTRLGKSMTAREERWRVARVSSTALFVLLLIMACTRHPETRYVELEHKMTTFECGRAGALLGRPGATATRCEEVLPGLWWVILTWEESGHTEGEVHKFVWLDGRRREDKGYALLGEYLRRMAIASRTRLDVGAAQVMLEATGGLPQGFGANALSQRLDGESGRVSTNPFELVLIERPRIWGPGGPPRPEGPPGAPLTPGGPPPGGPPGGGPPGAVPVLGLRRATLRVVGDRFQWLIEDRSAAPGAGWVERSRETF